jgi:hypothetical protein
MASDIDAAVAGLRADVARVRASMPRRRRRPVAIPEAEQVRRFVSGEERIRLERGEVTPAEWRRYQEAMLEKLGGMGVLEV